MKGISLFSSAGIGEMYIKDLGIDIIVANEIDKKRCELYKYFHPESEMINGDIQDSTIKNELIKKSKIKWHSAKTHNYRDINAMKHTPEGKSALLNKEHYPKKEDGTRISGVHNTYKRMKWDEPAKARTTNCGNIGSHNNVHPGRKLKDGTYSDARVLTIKELFLLTGLGEDFDLPINTPEMLIRQVIGECVPPSLIYEITNTI